MLAELEKLSRLVKKDDGLHGIAQCQILSRIQYKGKEYPIHSFTVGSKDPTHPVLFLTGGFHGLERIGAQLAWSLLKTTLDRLVWDRALRELFGHVRLVALPLVNPVGYVHFLRSNGHGVDLMRNSPVHAKEPTPFLLGGQRISNHCPWYRGEEGVLEDENQAVLSAFLSSAEQSSCVIALDFHSGFGMRDRLWFPYSCTKHPFEDLPAMHALTQLLEQTHPYHIYQIEPQSKGYLLNGDLWDYLFFEFKSRNLRAPFLPMTLEMGSWNWVRKNPLQIFSRDGVFNPVKEHRVKRTYRRHHLLFDFLLRALRSPEVWSCRDPLLRQKHEQMGLARWYEN